MAQWVVIGLVTPTSLPWPTEEMVVPFHGHTILMRPETDTLAPDLAIQFESPSTFEEILLLGRRFLSALAWIEGAPVQEEMVTGGTNPIRVGKGHGKFINPHFRADHIPSTDSSRSILALAFYREALGLNSVPYQFLSFYKIINLLHSGGADQMAWINQAIPSIDDHFAKERIRELQTENANIGNYLYVSGRCAIAHAYTEPLVDPENPADTTRLRKDLPLIRGLAEYAIEHELGILSKKTIYRQHLYELKGFKEIIGEQTIKALKAGLDISASYPTMPRLSIRIRDKAKYPAFENMSAQVTEASNSCLAVDCRSQDSLFGLRLLLNFGIERLQCDPFTGVQIVDDQTPSPVAYALDLVQFRKDLLLNGQLEVWNKETETLLGRCDAFIGVNIDLGASVESMDEEKRRLEGELEKRKGRSI